MSDTDNVPWPDVCRELGVRQVRTAKARAARLGFGQYEFSRETGGMARADFEAMKRRAWREPPPLDPKASVLDALRRSATRLAVPPEQFPAWATAQIAAVNREIHNA